MAFLDADVGERFFVYGWSDPGNILLAVKVLDIDDWDQQIMLRIFRNGESYNRIFANDQEETANLPRKCNVGGAFINPRMLLLIAADKSYAIAREKFYTRRTLPKSGAHIQGFDLDPFSLRYSNVILNNFYVSRPNIRDLRRGPLEVLTENNLVI